jgi:uncharacterized membrane protein (UPF0136 family)
VTIDPMNAPIFGDVLPADPPKPIRIAAALLLGNVAITAGYRMYTAFDASFSIFMIPMALAVWFALSLRVGRSWARTASTVLSCLSIGMLVFVAGYAMINSRAAWGLDLAALALTATMLVSALRLMWRPDVNDYFVL